MMMISGGINDKAEKDGGRGPQDAPSGEAMVDDAPENGAGPLRPLAPTLARFCEFIENRLRTESFELFRRIVDEFLASYPDDTVEKDKMKVEGKPERLPANSDKATTTPPLLPPLHTSPTLESFVDVAATLITILPFEITDTQRRARAEETLLSLRPPRRRRACTVPARHRSAFFVWLEATVASKHLAELEGFFEDFARGEEDRLVAFCKAQDRVISLIPFHLPPPQQPPTDEPQGEPSDQGSECRSGSRGSIEREGSDDMYVQDPDEEAAADADEDPDTGDEEEATELHEVDVGGRRRGRRWGPRGTPKARARPASTSLEPVGPIKRCRGWHIRVFANGQVFPAQRETFEVVTEAFEAALAARPWESIFDLSRLEYPFDPVRHPEIAACFRAFWAKHRETVWERLFWYRYSARTAATSKDTRKRRQDCATRMFESRIIRPLYRAYGAQFFVDLDNGPRLHWWWYRTATVDLFSLHALVGRGRFLRYVHEESTRRFPAVPPEVMRTFAYEPRSPSMWSPEQKHLGILREIERLKRAQQGADAAAATIKEEEGHEEYAIATALAMAADDNDNDANDPDNTGDQEHNRDEPEVEPTAFSQVSSPPSEVKSMTPSGPVSV